MEKNSRTGMKSLFRAVLSPRASSMTHLNFMEAMETKSILMTRVLPGPQTSTTAITIFRIRRMDRITNRSSGKT